MSTPVLELLALWDAWLLQEPTRVATDPATLDKFRADLAEGGHTLEDHDWRRFVALWTWKTQGDGRPLAQDLAHTTPPQSVGAGFHRQAPYRRPAEAEERVPRLAQARSRRRMAAVTLLVGLFLVGLFGLHASLREAPVFIAVGALIILAGAYVALTPPRPSWFHFVPSTQRDNWRQVPELAWVMAGVAWACPAMRGDAALFHAYVRHVHQAGRVV